MNDDTNNELNEPNEPDEGDDRDGTVESAKKFIKKLMRGEYGLVRTFWIYGVVVFFILSAFWEAVASVYITDTDSIIIETAPSPNVLFLLFMLLAGLADIAYRIAVIIGVWRAAELYQGAQLWAFLAKASALLLAILIFLGIFAAFSLGFSQGFATQPSEQHSPSDFDTDSLPEF